MLHLDYETRSTVELSGPETVGLHNYATNKTTGILMLGWAYDQEPPELWQPHLGDMPDRLRKGLEDPNQKLAAFNCAFERYITQYQLGIVIPAARFADPQISCRYLAIPAKLKDVCPVLDMPLAMRKDDRGDQLIDIFSYPTKGRKKKGQQAESYFRDWMTDPELWQEFCNYCKQDIIAERELLRRVTLLEAYPLPEKEQKIWVFDQKVNDRGIPVNISFVKSALKLATREKEEAVAKQNTLTGLENANSNSQMLKWAKTQGYERNTLRKGAVDAALKYSETLTPLCREVFEARKAASSTSYKKMGAILRCVSADERLRNQFIFMGSSRCSRWSGNAVQFHNFSRPSVVGGYDFEDIEVVEEARGMIFKEDYDGIKQKYGSVLLVVKSLIRTAFSVEQ